MGMLFTDQTGQRILGALDRINATIGGSTKGTTVYGFHINSSEANPSLAVSYVRDAVGMVPAKMDYEHDVFNWGTWGDAFFLPRPCMVKSSGVRDYYLDPDDYTKKLDGTPSDVANIDYDGNAMMEWGNGEHIIWIKFVADKNDPHSGTVLIADHKEDDGFTCYPFINRLGNQVMHFYTPIYNGSLVKTVLRSISGQAIMINQNAQNEVNAARRNGDAWNTEMWCDVQLINALLILMGKSLDTQSVFGNGNYQGGSQTTLLNPGTMNDKGMFWGSNSTASPSTVGVKVFGMENWWGNQWRRFAGLINDNGAIKAKLCFGTADGSDTDDYNITGAGYIDTGLTSPANGYVKHSVLHSTGLYPSVTSGGSSTTYYCDYHYTNNANVNYASRGGACGDSSVVGAFYLYLCYGASLAGWCFGAAPSCKPLL